MKFNSIAKHIKVKGITKVSLTNNKIKENEIWIRLDIKLVITVSKEKLDNKKTH